MTHIFQDNKINSMRDRKCTVVVEIHENKVEDRSQSFTDSKQFELAQDSLRERPTHIHGTHPLQMAPKLL